MTINEIQNLIKFVAKSGVSEVELELKDLKINIKTSSSKKEIETIIQQIPVPAVAAAVVAPVVAPVAAAAIPEAPVVPPVSDDSKYITIKSPMIGTFYRSANPESPTFVNVGDDIANGKVICIIEAMKLFNEIEAEISGKIVKVLVDDSTPVEYDQPLFLVDPT